MLVGSVDLWPRVSRQQIIDQQKKKSGKQIDLNLLDNLERLEIPAFLRKQMD